MAAPASATDAGGRVPAAIEPMAGCAVPAKANDSVLKTLLTVGRKRHINSRVQLAEFETAWVESHANNLKCGDSDSVGVFQQRPSAGWGTKKQCENVTYATNAFLNHAIAVNKAHPTWSAGHVSWYVQQPAAQYRGRYDAAKGKANSLISRARTLV
jgi:hypothetical protein